MGPEEAVAALKALEPYLGDPEAAHGLADDVLLAFVPADVERAYRKLMESAPWWASA